MNYKVYEWDDDYDNPVTAVIREDGERFILKPKNIPIPARAKITGSFDTEVDID